MHWFAIRLQLTTNLRRLLIQQKMEKYIEFLKSKMAISQQTGFEVEQINEVLFPFQKHCVSVALRKGRFALFQNCGLGKTLQQIEWCYHISEKTNAPVLILAPLAVSGQTILQDNEFLKYGVKKLDIDNQHDLKKGIYIINYDQLDNVDASVFSGVALDESSILKNFEGKTRNLILEKFEKTPYKTCWTATPSPNDPMELGNHAEFLGVMKRNEMLSMYFVHDGGDTSKWRLKKHAEKKFWQWVSSWAIMINVPSDIGFSDDGYILPKMNLIEKIISTKKRENGLLFNDIAVSATNFNAELRITLLDRLDKAVDIVNNSTENFIVWIKQNEEGSFLKKNIPDSVEVRGSDNPEIKEKNLLGFSKNEFRVLITKAKIAQFGLNYQNCHNQIFASLDFSFESLYQAIRRSLRFGQKNEVNIYIITTDTMQNVIENIKEKQRKFDEMNKNMVEAMKTGFSETKKQEISNQNLQLPKFLTK